MRSPPTGRHRRPAPRSARRTWRHRKQAPPSLVASSHSGQKPNPSKLLVQDPAFPMLSFPAASMPTPLTCLNLHGRPPLFR
ncbi:hypothetical protein ZWY2020_059968 [Hordeum vulgare]|nr:hypothetical protein ZWY2020_059968 [Hordeum vulgare]